MKNYKVTFIYCETLIEGLITTNSMKNAISKIEMHYPYAEIIKCELIETSSH